MRISDWSSDVCSSDLTALSSGSAAPRAEFLFPMRGWKVAGLLGELGHIGVLVPHGGLEGRDRRRQIQDSGVLVPHEGLEDEDSRRSEGTRTVLVPNGGLEG